MIAVSPDWLRYVAGLETTRPDLANPIPPRCGSRHWRSDLNEALVAEIRNSKETGAAIARRLKKNPGTISRIRSGKLWRHVPS
jgi:hypothetical protein